MMNNEHWKFMSFSVKALEPQTTRNTVEVEVVLWQWEGSNPLGNQEVLRKGVLERGYCGIWAVFRWFWWELKEAGLWSGLDAVRKQDKSMFILIILM